MTVYYVNVKFRFRFEMPPGVVLNVSFSHQSCIRVVDILITDTYTA